MSPRSRTTIFTAAAVCLALYAHPERASAQDTWPCEVLLCVSNPGGMVQFKECLPPIRRLITHLAFGKGFPTCTGGGTRSVKYQKPKNGRNGSVTIQYEDGRRETYVVPLASQLPPPDPSGDELPEDYR